MCDQVLTSAVRQVSITIATVLYMADATENLRHRTRGDLMQIGMEL